jgi:hypothetical protein
VFNFLKVGRRPSDVPAEEMEYLRRKREFKASHIGKNNDDGVSDDLIFISEIEASFNYIGPFIEIIRKRLFLWSGKMLDICERNNYQAKRK